MYYDKAETSFFCTSVDKFAGYLYVCNFDEERPTNKSMKINDCRVSYLNKTNDTEFIIMGRDDG